MCIHDYTGSPDFSAKVWRFCVALISSIFSSIQPHSLVEQLSRYRQVVAEEELREKQLGSLRVDACSTEALKRLKGQRSQRIYLGVH